MNEEVRPIPLIIPDAACLHEAALSAHRANQFLIHNGDGRVHLSPILVPGWFEVAVTVEPAKPLPNAGALEIAA